MHKLSGQWKCVFAMAVCAAMLHAQTGDRTTAIGGTVLDVTGKPIPSAAVTLKNEATGAVHQVVASADGKFSAEHLAAGVYTIEVSAPSFASSRRTGVTAGATGSNDLKISLNVGNCPRALQWKARSLWRRNLRRRRIRWRRDRQNRRSAPSSSRTSHRRSPITPNCSTGAGHVQRQPQRRRPGRQQDFFRGFNDGQYTMRWTVFRSTTPTTPRTIHGRFSPASSSPESISTAVPGSASTIGPTNFGGSINLLSRSVPYDTGYPRHGVVRILQYPHAGAGFRFRAVRRKEQEVEPDDQPSPDAIGRIPDLQLSEARRRLHQVSVPAERPDDVHAVRRPGRSVDQHAEPEGADARRTSRSSATTTC